MDGAGPSSAVALPGAKSSQIVPQPLGPALPLSPKGGAYDARLVSELRRDHSDARPDVLEELRVLRAHAAADYYQFWPENPLEDPDIAAEAAAPLFPRKVLAVPNGGGHAPLGIPAVHLQVAQFAWEERPAEEEIRPDAGPQREKERLSAKVPPRPEAHLGQASRRGVVGQVHGPPDRLPKELGAVASDKLLVEVGGRQDGAPLDDARESDSDRAAPSEVRRDHAGRVGHLGRGQREGCLDPEAAGKEPSCGRVDGRALDR